MPRATTSAKLTVNDNDSTLNPYGTKKTESGKEFFEFEVTLVAGENAVELSLPMGYDAWLFGYEIGAVQQDTSPKGDDDPEKPDEKKDKGCNSSITLGIGCVGGMSALALGVAAVVSKRKKK